MTPKKKGNKSACIYCAVCSTDYKEIIKKCILCCTLGLPPSSVWELNWQGICLGWYWGSRCPAVGMFASPEKWTSELSSSVFSPGSIKLILKPEESNPTFHSHPLTLSKMVALTVYGWVDTVGPTCRPSYRQVLFYFPPLWCFWLLFFNSSSINPFSSPGSPPTYTLPIFFLNHIECLLSSSTANSSFPLWCLLEILLYLNWIPSPWSHMTFSPVLIYILNLPFFLSLLLLLLEFCSASKKS